MWILPLTFLLTWLWLGTRSAWLTTVMHGSANIGASLVFPVTDPATSFAFGGLGTTVVAIVVVGLSWSQFAASPRIVPAPPDAKAANAGAPAGDL